ncbi:hypothetical protein RhiirC2_786155 [Rhizophagus irregularis]|uniref:Uncharacterized protein n=1 Tax=Rhizophagus irregularis TaxID=588596 RepID=A0A2N1MUY4_9GLOM|nr:hypothetical protein RhiirC2_786155 [Rhizophagus irregularis]
MEEVSEQFMVEFYTDREKNTNELNDVTIGHIVRKNFRRFLGDQASSLSRNNSISREWEEKNLKLEADVANKARLIKLQEEDVAEKTRLIKLQEEKIINLKKDWRSM